MAPAYTLCCILFVGNEAEISFVKWAFKILMNICNEITFGGTLNHKKYPSSINSNFARLAVNIFYCVLFSKMIIVAICFICQNVT